MRWVPRGPWSLCRKGSALFPFQRRLGGDCGVRSSLHSIPCKNLPLLPCPPSSAIHPSNCPKKDFSFTLKYLRVCPLPQNRHLACMNSSLPETARWFLTVTLPYRGCSCLRCTIRTKDDLQSTQLTHSLLPLGSRPLQCQ